MKQLPVFLLIRNRPVILVGEGEAANAKRRLLERAGACCVGIDDQTARLAIIAADGDNDAVTMAAALRARGLLVNVVDRPELCDFTVPAIVDRDPLLVAIGTGGASAGLAKTVRQIIERLLPERIGRLAEALGAARAAMRNRWPDAAERRRQLDAALAPGALLDPLRDDAADHVASWLASEADAASFGLERIVLRSDDPDDLTLREARLLALADHLYLGDDVPEPIAARARADAVRHRGPAPSNPPGGLAIQIEIGNG